MSKIIGRLNAVAALALLLGAGGASAQQQRDDRPSPPPPPPQRAAPQTQATREVSRPAPDRVQQAPREVPRPVPDRVQQAQATRGVPPPVPDRAQQVQVPRGVPPSTPGRVKQAPRFAPPVAPVPGGVSPRGALPPGGAGFNSNGGPRFNPGGSSGVRPSNMTAYRGILPRQYRPGLFPQAQRGPWRGPPPGLRPARAWQGGNWRGGYWPAVYYTGSYPLFLSVLPSVYSTYWWGAVPYYYANNVYYTWSAPDDGYVVTDPPPMLSDADLGAIDVDGSGAGAAGMAPPPSDVAQGVPGDLYVYPRNGQSPDQLASDKYACHTWAVQQSGYDPTNPGYGGGDPDAYRRAMIACLDARGYSAN